MKCPKCGFLSSNNLERCKRCGADWTGERAQIENQIDARIRERARREAEALAAEMAPPEEPVTKPEADASAGEVEVMEVPAAGTETAVETEREPEASEETFDREQQVEPEAEPAVGQARSRHGLTVTLDGEFDRLYEVLRAQEAGSDPPRWGGFYRRSAAFSIDILVLSLLSILLFYLISIGFHVGLSAHGQTVTMEHFFSLIRIFMLAWLGLAAGYFVMLPTMCGMTVGKWVLGLRIVTVNRAPISYPQAMLRWLGYAVSAPLALGFLWILLSREKRAWHDLIARTWVVRERGSQSA